MYDTCTHADADTDTYTYMQTCIQMERQTYRETATDGHSNRLHCSMSNSERLHTRCNAETVATTVAGSCCKDKATASIAAATTEAW